MCLLVVRSESPSKLHHYITHSHVNDFSKETEDHLVRSSHFWTRLISFYRVFYYDGHVIYYLLHWCYWWDTCTYICWVYQSLPVNCCNTRNEKWTLQYYGHFSTTKWQEYCNTITLQHGNIAMWKYCNTITLQHNKQCNTIATFIATHFLNTILQRNKRCNTIATFIATCFLNTCRCVAINIAIGIATLHHHRQCNNTFIRKM